ncbi:MAG: aminopeptidase P family N-terminal domain-containing protein, partial [Pseudomonadota bacterium]
MKQNFDVKGGPQIGRENLPKLRAEMQRQGLDGFYVPHEDEYQNEYLPEANERLAWVSGFTGSFGSAMILMDRAVLFADGRYTIQAADQTDNDLFERVHVPDPGPFGWLGTQDLKGRVLGYDAALMTPNDVATFEAATTKAGATIRSVTENPVDLAWTD